MTRLTVLYDQRCSLCRWARRWLERQRQLVELDFLPAEGDEARRRFPTLATDGTPEDLVVVGDGGEVYRNGAAWVMVLYALDDYREWSLRLGSPALLPLAREAFHLLSTHRQALSRWLRLDADDRSWGEALSGRPAPACERPVGPAAPGLHSGFGR